MTFYDIIFFIFIFIYIYIYNINYDVRKVKSPLEGSYCQKGSFSGKEFSKKGSSRWGVCKYGGLKMRGFQWGE